MPVDVQDFKRALGQFASGVTVVIVRKDLVENGRKDVPVIFQYRTHSENNSLYNTPPTFSIYVLRNVLDELKKAGGLAAAEKRNNDKAKLLYDYLDGSAFFVNPVAKEDRSRMNVPFRLRDPALDAEFLKGAEARGMLQLKGHRSVGGMRASIYNAMPIEGVRALVEYMDEFERQRG